MKKIFVLIIFVLSINFLIGQKTVITGKVLDKNNSEPLIGATVVDISTGSGTFTNDYGSFALRVPQRDKYILKITYVGYDTVYAEVDKNNLYKEHVFYLQPGVNIKGVEVIGTRHNNAFTYYITQKEIKILPSLTGDYDVLKSFQLLPGVQFGMEGMSNLFILGGTPDQNLILLDGIPIFYVNHLFGFVSIFDIEAIRKAELVRSGFDPKYGGRLSGFINILLKNGDPIKYHTTINTGLLSSRISSNGYLIKNKLTYLFSLRYSTFAVYNYIAQLFGNPNQNLYDFYDFTWKLNFNLNNHNTFQWIFYKGNDRFIYRISDSRLLDKPETLPIDNWRVFYSKINMTDAWGNLASGVKWIYNKNNFFVVTTAGYTKYEYKFDNKAQELKEIKNAPDSLISEIFAQRKNYIDMSFVHSDLTFKLSSKSQLNLGLFYEYYLSLPFQSEITKKDSSLNIRSYSDSVSHMDIKGGYLGFDFNSGIIRISPGIRTFLWNSKIFISPRLRMRIKFNKSISLNVAASKTYQPIHILANGTNFVPQDVWIVSRPNFVQPESSKLFDGNIVFRKKHFWLTIGGFNKRFNNLIDYNRISFGTERSIWDKIITGGIGWAYGLYSTIQYTSEKFIFWTSYTYIQNFRQFKTLNYGRPFPNYYHRKHNLNVVLTLRPWKHWDFTAVFIYGSGMAYSLSTTAQNYIWPEYSYNGFYELNNIHFPYVNYILENSVPVYTSINNYRLPPYHRLDIAIRYQGTWKKFKKKYILGLNITNVYCHLNPQMVYVENNYYTHKVKLVEFSLLPIIPSISFEIKL